MNRVQPNGNQPRNGPAPAANERLLRHMKELHRQLISSLDLSAVGSLS